MGARFLVSTTQHLLAIDPDLELVWRVHSGKGLYFGLTSDPNGRIYAACRNTTLGPKDESVRAAERGSILVFDSRFRISDELAAPFPLRDVHGMEYIHGRLWITCSFDNMVAIYDISKAAWGRWYPAPNPAHHDRDVDHFNTVRFIEDQIWIVAHRFGASQVLVYNYPTLNLCVATPLGNMAHDVLSYGGALAACSSADGCILNINGERLRTGNFPRGIAQSSSGNLLGISMDTARSERARQNGILRWYTPEWRFVLDCVLPNAGMVLHVMELSTDKYSWDELERWPFARFSRSEYNQVSPGNVYGPDCVMRNRTLAWHDPEETHCWSAARDASFPISVCPGESRLTVELSSSCPSRYYAELFLDRNRLGDVVFEQPGVQRREFLLNGCSAGEHKLIFRVPHLWKPVSRIPNNDDPRPLGIAMHSVTLNF